MRAFPWSSALLALGLTAVFGFSQLRLRAAEPHLEAALAAFDTTRARYPDARLSPERLTQVPAAARETLLGLARNGPARPRDALLDAALEDVLRSAARLPQNQQGHSPSNPTWQGVAMSMFTHVQLAALVGNLILLMFFAPAVERRWGRWGPPLIFVAGGVGGLLAHHMLAPADMGPLIGASGGALGLLAAMTVPGPRPAMNRVGPLPAWLVLAVLVALELLATLTGAVPSMSHAAHLGGMIAGLGAGVLARVGRRSSVAEA